MIGFKQFQDDLKTLRLALYGRVPADLAHQALTRVEGFANTLENLDVYKLYERPQGAPPRTCECYRPGGCESGRSCMCPCHAR